MSLLSDRIMSLGPVGQLITEKLREAFTPSELEVVDESHKHEKKDANTIEFNVPVAADSEVTVTYTVRITQ